MKVHELKTDPIVFQDSRLGKKRFEIRFNDRGFEVGDQLILKETRYSGEQMKGAERAPLVYTGRELTVTVTYILCGYGLLPGWVVMGVAL
jgi:hypothetical protein